MDPTTIGIRLGSAAVAPLIKKFFRTEGPGAGLVDKPVRISSYVSFRGEKRSLTEADVTRLAGQLVRQASGAAERPVSPDEHQAVTDALATTLHALGDLTITDLDAVRLGPAAFVRELRAASGHPERELSADATYFYERLLDVAALHILHFFTQRSTFVAHALVMQSRALHDVLAKTDELIRRTPLPEREDVTFEAKYLPYLARKHGKLTIYGIDLTNSPNRWPLDVAYLSLEAAPLDHARAVTGLSPVREAPAAFSNRGQLPSYDLYDQLSGSGPQAADQVLARSRRVFLRGEAGSGKTTLVQWLAVTAARARHTDQTAYLRDRIPFVLPLRTLTRHGDRLPAPKDFLTAIGCPLAGTQPAGWENRVLAAGRGLVLVDGIDEIPDAERERTRRWLRELIETYDGDNRWLVTSRPSAVGQDWLAQDGFDELALSAMGPTETATFIGRWHAAARTDAEDTAGLDKYEEQLLSAVRTKPDLGRLATNPLMCGLICALHRDRGGYLPDGRKDLYEAALSMLLTRRDRERDMPMPELREEPQLDLLQRLAYWLIKNGRTEMDRERAEDIIARALPSVPEMASLGPAPVVYAHFLQRSGLLREPAPGTVDFVHRTFQDFLGARAAVEEGDFGLLTQHATDDQWEDVIRMSVALARPAERVTLLRGLLALGDRAAQPRVRSRVHLLAAACLEHATSLDPAVREAVHQRTATLIPPTDEEQARALAEVGPLLLDLLPGPEHLDDRTAYPVVIAASHVKSDAAIGFLSRFAAHPDLSIRSQLLWAWSRFDLDRYADEVIARLDPANLMYTVRSDAQLKILERLGLRPDSLDVREDVSLKALASYASRYTFKHLALSHETTDLGFLTAQPRLESVFLTGCSPLVDLSALSALPLRSLVLAVEPGMDLGPVAELRTLERLVLEGLTSGLDWSVRSLPAQAPLTDLTVSGSLSPREGLSGLGRLRTLTSLTLNAWSGPASTDDWREIQDLPALTFLSLGHASFEALPTTMVLPRLTHLRLVFAQGESAAQAAVDRLPEAFPGLRVLELARHLTGEGTLDLAPLAALPVLKAVFTELNGVQVRGTEKLPRRVRIQHNG